MSRADQVTQRKVTPEYYSDFLVNFNKNPITGILARVTNEEDVANAMKLLVLTRLYERPYQPDVGSKANAILFDLIDETSASQLEFTVSECIKNHEPRATLHGVEVSADPENNGYQVNIFFSLINIPDRKFSTSLFLTRVR